MKAPHILVLLTLAACTGGLMSGADVPAVADAPVAPKSPVTPALSPRFKQVRERIAALYQYRNETPPAPDPKLNPFRAPGAFLEIRPPVTGGEPLLPSVAVAEPADAPSSDLTRLQQSVATLRVTGTSEKDGRLYIAINAKLFKDNDVIQVQLQGEPVYLRVRKITRRGVTVVLNEAEMALKF